MLSLFPQPVQFPLPEFQSLLVTGPAQASAPIHLALSDGLASLNDTWIASDSRCGSVLNAVSRIDMLYPPTPVHLCMLLSMLRLPSSEGDDSATCLDPRTTKIGSPGLVILHEPSLYFTPRQESHTVSSYTILIAQAFATIRTFTNQSQPQLVVFDSRLNDLKLPVAKPQTLDPFAEVQEPVEEDPQPLVKYVEPFFDSIAIVGNNYLLYGRFYLPSRRLDALYSTRLSPTLQASIAAISQPIANMSPELRNRRGDPSNIMFNLQHDIGKWCTEYTYSAEDGMWGIRVLHNFGRLASSVGENGDSASAHSSGGRVGVKRVDEEDAVEGGLKGRVSIGAELYVSAKERSAGVSTGIRFSTLPDATPPSAHVPPPSPFTPEPSTAADGTPPPAAPSPRPHQTPQPPTTITALFNPMLGHVQTAYTARVSRDLTLSSRFDFNVYSYESEWTMGAEWWLRRSPRSHFADGEGGDEEEGKKLGASFPSPLGEVHGVVKARASTNNDVSLMWEGRIRQMLIGLGVVSDLSSRAKPIKAIGLEVSYFSSE
ncbi:hypothetical protein D9611_002225 [Ephemerocybe angulata]|uniref:Mitochondrial distribution and morphology protein 10 n=1 Tax=Ephemerocybe angulata TaxID=980116 RepID=A0A8H5C355_9AGAR|nr:hypothetical protein D9611_002225 [Tulosesus angulatus]